MPSSNDGGVSAGAWLAQARTLEARADAAERRADQLDKEADALRSVPMDTPHVQGGPQSGGAAFVRALERVDEARADARRQIALLTALRAQIRDAIDAMDDPDERLILEDYYLLGMSDDGIAQLLDVHRTTAWRTRMKALDHIAMPPDPIVIRGKNGEKPADATNATSPA